MTNDVDDVIIDAEPFTVKDILWYKHTLFQKCNFFHT